MGPQSGAIRCFLAPYTLAGALAAWLSFFSSATAQLRDSFEGPERSWQISKEANCGVRVLAHDRPYREAHSGQACEHFRLTVGQGTFLPLVHSIGRAPLIQEFRPALYVKADRPSLQLMVRVVFPRNIDRGTGQPITSLLRGDTYTDVGQWQRLTIRDIGRLLEQETRSLRTQFGSEVDSREVFVDFVVLNAYSAPGTIDLWIDDLEIAGYVNIDGAAGPQVARRSASDEAAGSGASHTLAPAAVNGSLFMVGGRPFMPRAVQHRGEPFEWLQSVGFNTIKLSTSPSPAELKEARRLKMWLIAPPPYGDQPSPEVGYDTVIAWSLGTRLTERDIPGTRELTTEIRNFDAQQDRPLLAGVDSSLSQYSRLAHILALERCSLGTSAELAEMRSWFLGRTRLARPGTPALAAIETQRTERLGEQLLLFGRGAAWEEDVDPEQLRLQTYHAIAGGARGFLFPSNHLLAIDTGPAAMRTDAIRLINMELRLLEPWIAGGQLAEEMASVDGGMQVSTLVTDRSRLLILTQHAAAQQFVLGVPPRNSLSIVVPGVGVSDRAHLITLAGIKPLRISHSSSGARIALDDVGNVAAVVITQDHLATHHLHRIVAEIKQDACHLRHDVAQRRLAHVVEVDRRLTELGHPLPIAAASIRDANATLLQAARLLETRDYDNCHLNVAKAEQIIAKIRRGHWEQTAAAFPSPASSPCVAQFTTLPLHWTTADRLRKGHWGPNVQAAGDMESLDQMLKAGWQQQRTTSDEFSTDVSLSLADPHSGRTALRLQATAANRERAPEVMESARGGPVWVVSSPIPVRQGQFVRIHGWTNVPKRLAGSSEGLLVFDSLGGSDLGDRIRLTQGWREFTLYRAVPQTGEMTVTFALTGLGEASVDDLAVAVLEPEPIRQK